jgi:uncharacterized protein (TIGR03435 family)
MQIYGVKAIQLSIPEQFQFRLRYDIVAKIPPGTTTEQFNGMMQNLLADRFGMRFHREPKQFDAYKLVVSKSGPRLKETKFASVIDKDDPKSRVRQDSDGVQMIAGVSALRAKNGNYMMSGGDLTTRDLARLLEGWFRSPVTDATGLTEKYDIRMEFSPEGLPALARNPPTASAPDAPSDPAPNIFQALERQLGLKLEKSTAVLDMLIVDYLGAVPAEN